ncbi:helix-turn-helix domain-containing protein [Paenibacillus sp. GXUN7292]|uniref:helix-turn-helix domain-containing protein n=1 Tax=Paenibacillus sp. GXUN7292 TaxID=3422499 RepID=UPI003D7C5722
MSEDTTVFSVSVPEMMGQCDISRRTVYDWINKGIVRSLKTPSGLMIHREDVEYLSSFLSVRSVAKKIDVPYVFLLNLVRENNALVETNLSFMQGKYYVSRVWVNEHRELILESYEKSKGSSNRRKNFGRRMQLYQNKLRLFDELSYEGNTVRLLSVEPPLKYMGSKGDIGCIGDPHYMGHSKECANTPYMGYGGSVVFRFSYGDLRDQIQALDSLVYWLGEKNVQVYEDQTCFNVICRYSLIPFHEGIYKPLIDNVIEGDVWEDNKGNIVIGDYEMRLKLPIKYRQLLDLEQKLEDKNINKWFADCVENFINGQ